LDAILERRPDFQARCAVSLPCMKFLSEGSLRTLGVGVGVADDLLDLGRLNFMIRQRSGRIGYSSRPS
jgi:hypothetical protein